MAAIVAALFVATGGIYFDLPDVDPWDEARDARLYDGPHPVVAHPPCARWCRLAKFVESQYPTMRVGDDGGTFASALASVRRCGGVLEHPAWSMAWAAHGLIAPPAGGWHRDIDGGWCCEVAQSAYGHRATKRTWLYYVGANPPAPLNWGAPRGGMVVGHCKRSYGGRIFRANGKRMRSSEASATPPAFAEVLLSLARGAHA
jgi:hypothetical protein